MMASLAVPAATSATEAAAATTPTQGIDVSSLQHPTTTSTINWSSVKSAGKAFTGVKASEGDYYTNPFYAQDVEQAVAAGLYVSPYVFANPHDPTPPPGNGDGTFQADYAWNKEISKVTSPAYTSSPLMLPITVDLEPDPYASQENSNSCYGLSQSAMRTWIGQFLTEAKRLSGKTPIIYTSANWWNACTGNYTGFNTSPLWLASYGVSNPALPSGWNNLTIWQYSAGGSVTGISTAVDLDELGPTVQASQVSKAIGPLQLRTLGSLATPSTSVSYSLASGSSLPPGLRLTSAGQISGTPTTIGQTTLTITPSSGTAMPITWYVHGTITLTPPGNHTTTAGTPVWMRVKATDTDAGKAPAPSFAAAGLPPGLSITPGGIISGWPYRPGTYNVTVAASDSLYASATTTFTWTVTAASGAGATGTLRQWGGSNKCLDDSGYGKSSGAAVDLWSCTGNWNQNWTFAQDGTVRVNGNLCLDVVGESTQNYAKMQLWACNSGDNAQQWRVGSNSQLINPRSGKCLTVAVASAANGYRPVLGTCATGNVANQHWLRPAANVYSGNAGKCLAVSGSTVVSATCANTSAQHWTESWNGTLQNGSNCLTEAGTTAGSGLSVGSCSGAAATHWQLLGVGSLPLATEIKSAASGDCVSAPSAANGVALNIQACVDTDGTTWHAE